MRKSALGESAEQQRAFERGRPAGNYHGLTLRRRRNRKAKSRPKRGLVPADLQRQVAVLRSAAGTQAQHRARREREKSL